MTNEQLAARIRSGENVGNNMAALYDQVKDFIHAMAYKYHGQENWKIWNRRAF